MSFGNGIKDRIPVYVVSILITLLTTYFAAQMIVTKEIGDRPTRGEVRAETQDIREQLRREMETLKEQQREFKEEQRDQGRKIDKILEKLSR